jgi:23S rRNA (uracil1939-C5)-methyltransferase
VSTQTPSGSTESAIPPCPHFGPCGGCQLQNLTYDAQLHLKCEQLRTLLSATGLALPELHLHASPPLGYRNRIRLTLAHIDGQLRAGYLRTQSGQEGWPILSQSHRDRVGYRAPLDRLPPGSEPSGYPRSGGVSPDVGLVTPPSAPSNSIFLPITQCPIAAPLLWRAAEAFLTLVNEKPSASLITPDQLELFTTPDESKLQLTLYLRTGLKNPPASLITEFHKLCEQLRIRVPELTGAGIALLPLASKDRSRRTEIPKPGPTWGAPGLNYAVDETSYWVPRGAFFQVNRFLIPELVDLVTANRSGQLAWDLYAGVGLFSRVLARSFDEVVAVEIAEPAATALASTKLPNLHAVKATTLDFLRAAVIQRKRPDLIVLDPPRTGAGPEVCTLLARVAAPTLVFVSCSPQTLPADLTTLVASGYSIAELHLVDLFPQTTHLETVAILHR